MAQTTHTSIYRTNDGSNGRYPDHDVLGEFARVSIIYPHSGQQYGITMTLDEAYDFANNILAVLTGVRT